MKVKVLLLIVCTIGFGYISFAQKDAGIKGLLNSNGEIALPLTVSEINTKTGLKGKVVKVPEGGNAVTSHAVTWQTKTGLVIASDIDADMKLTFVTISGNDSAMLSGLPYNLVLNKSTLAECEAAFKAYKFIKTDIGVSESTPEGGNKLDGKRGRYYVSLIFNEKNKLTLLQIATFNLNAAN